MGVVFPLSTGGFVVLCIITVVLGIICWMMWKPQHWKWLFSKLKSQDGGKVLQEKKNEKNS